MVPDTKSAPSTAELHWILQSAAYSMLESFLAQHRANRRSGSLQQPPSPELNTVSISLRLDAHSEFEFMKCC
jgi:hypothetical protein